MKVYVRPIVKVKNTTEKKTIMKSAACSGCSVHKALR